MSLKRTPIKKFFAQYPDSWVHTRFCQPRDVPFIMYDESSTIDWDSIEINKLLTKGYKDMEATYSTVEDLIQQTKDQNGRVYQKLRDQESRLSLLDSEATQWQRNHVCPTTSFLGATPEQMFRVLVSLIGTKGILKMLAER